MTRTNGVHAPLGAAARRHLLLASIVVLGGVLRFAELGARGFWRDEAVTVELLRRSFGGMLGELPESEGTPPLYYVLGWGWTRVFGDTEAGVRSLSALAGALTVVVAYSIGVELVSRRVGLAMALLVAVSPMLVWYAQDARAYALLSLLCAVSFLAFVRALSRPDPRTLTVWAVASALALATHYFAAPLLAAEAAWLLVTIRPRRGVAVAAGGVGLVALALAPLALAQRSNASVAWIAEIPRTDRIRELVEHFLVGPQAPHVLVAAGVSGVALLVACVLIVVRGDERERRAALLGSGVSLVAVALILGLSVGGFDYFIARNVLAVWVPVAVVAAAGLAGARAGRLGAATLAVAVATGIVVVVATADEPKYGAEDWRGAARALGRADDGRAIVLWLGVGSDPFLLYRPGARPLPARGADVREVAVVAVGGDHRRIAVEAGLRPRAPFERAARIDGEHFTIVRFRAPSPRHVTRESLVSGGVGAASAVLEDQR